MTVAIKLKINTMQTRLSKKLTESALRSGPCQMLISERLETWSVYEY